jgi:hypothetical protein
VTNLTRAGPPLSSANHNIAACKGVFAPSGGVACRRDWIIAAEDVSRSIFRVGHVEGSKGKTRYIGLFYPSCEISDAAAAGCCRCPKTTKVPLGKLVAQLDDKCTVSCVGYWILSVAWTLNEKLWLIPPPMLIVPWPLAYSPTLLGFFASATLGSTMIKSIAIIAKATTNSAYHLLFGSFPTKRVSSTFQNGTRLTAPPPLGKEVHHPLFA